MYPEDSSTTNVYANSNPNLNSNNILSESTFGGYTPSDYLGIWNGPGGPGEDYVLNIEKVDNYYKVNESGSMGINNDWTAEMTCTFKNNSLEFHDGALTMYRYSYYDKDVATFVEYINGSGFLCICAPDEIDSYYDRFSNYNIYPLARAWDGYGGSAVPSNNGSYLLLIEEPVEKYASSEFVIWYSSQIRLTEDDISFLSDEEKRIAVNEIYARHGRKFNDANLQQHFNQCSWYSGTIEPENFDENVFSLVEKYNLQVLAPSNGLNDPVGIYVGEDGVYMLDGTEDGILLNYVDISKTEDGSYEIWIGESYKGAPYGFVKSIYANTPFSITSEYKGYVSTRTLIFDGVNTITVTDEYQNTDVYHRINDDIKNHINYNY